MANLADLQGVLVRRVGRLLAAVGLDGATYLTPNGDLGDPIAEGLRRMGYPVASPAGPTDAEVGVVPPRSLARLLLWAELRCLESALTAATIRTDESLETWSEKKGQTAGFLSDRIAALKDELARPAVLGGASIGLGTIAAGSAIDGNPPDRVAWGLPSP